MKRLALALALAGCGSAPTCEQAFEKASKHLDTPRVQFSRMAKECEQGAYSADTRRCVAKVESLDDLEVCLASDPAFVELQQKGAREAKLAAEQARKEADEAMKAARAAQDQIVKIEQDLVELSQKVDAATDALAAAQNDADRAAAKAKLEQLLKERAAIEARVAAAKAEAEKAARAFRGSAAP